MHSNLVLGGDVTISSQHGSLGAAVFCRPRYTRSRDVRCSIKSTEFVDLGSREAKS
jgi:hypothetical protein